MGFPARAIWMDIDFPLCRVSQAIVDHKPALGLCLLQKAS